MSRRQQTLTAILILVAVYFGAGKFGLSLAVVNASASPVWPPTGLALAALLIFGMRLWPGVFLGAFLVNITTAGTTGGLPEVAASHAGDLWLSVLRENLASPGTVATMLGIATGNTLEAVSGAWLVKRFANGRRAFERPQDIFRFTLVAAFLSTLLSASCGASSLILGGRAAGTEFVRIWLTWWLGDVSSNLTVAPLLLSYWNQPVLPLRIRRVVEWVGLLLAAFVICQVVFNDILPFVYLTLLPLAWAAYRFGARSVLVVMIVTSAIALESAVYGNGRFSLADPNESMLYLQCFMSINTVMALVLTSAMAERKKAERRLQIQYDLSRVLAESRTLEEGAPKILEALSDAGGWDVSVIWREAVPGQGLRCAELWQRPGVNIPELAADIRERRLRAGECLPGQVWQAGKPVWVEDIARHASFPRAPVALREGLHAVLAFPLTVEHEIVGVIECFSRQVRAPEPDFLQTLATLGDQTGQLIARQRASVVLRDSEARFRQLAEHIHEVFWVSDVEKNQIQYVSPAYEVIWGRSCASLYASPRNWLEAVHPEDREQVLADATHKQARGEYDISYRITRPDGAVRWIRDRAFPVKNDAGTVYRIVGIAEDITAQQLAETRLRESEARKRAIMESAPDAILTIDAAGRVLELNTAAEQMFGCARDKIISREVAELFLPATAWQWFQRGLDRQFAGDSGPVLDGRLEVTARRADGNEFPAEFTLTRPDLAGPPVFTLFIRDITKRKQAEEQITTLAQAVASTAEMICITDLENRFVFANRAFLETFGYAEAEILGRTPEFLYAPNSPAGLMQQILAGTRSGGWRGEVLDRRKDGREIPIALSTSLVRNADGKVIGLMGVSQDITERRRAEEQIRLLANAVQSAQDMISITDSENRFTFVNEAFLRAYGYQASEVLGRTPRLLQARDNPDGIEETIFQETTAGGWTGELLNQTKAGKIFPVALSTSPIKSPDGKLLGLVGFASDITVRRRMERQSAAFAALGQQLSATSTPEEAAEIILGVAITLLNWDAGYVHLYSEAEDLVVPVLTYDTFAGKRQRVASETFATLLPSPLMRQVMRDGPRLINRQVAQPAALEFVSFGDTDRPSASMMYVPIETKGEVVGILSVQSYQPDCYGPEDLEILSALGNYCGGALQRINAAAAVREAEAKYRGIFENAGEGIFQLSPDGQCSNANPALARMFGYASPAEFMATAGSDGRHGRILPGRQDELQRRFEREGAVQGFETECVRVDGVKFWLSVNARQVRAPGGEVLRYDGTCRDVTELKRAEAVLRESEQRFRTLFESAPIAIALHAANGRILETNRAYQRMVGYDAGELRELGVRRITHAEDVAEGARLHAAMEAGDCDHYRREKRYLAKDGRVVWATAYATALRDPDGRLHYIISVVEDITERRRAQTEVRNLAAIVESSSDAILSTTPEGVIASWNQAAQRIYGYAPVEAIGQRFAMLATTEQTADLEGILREVREGKRIENFETVVRRKDGALVEISLTISPVLDGGGKVTGASAIGRDIGPRRQLEREILESGANERRRIGHDLHDGLGQILAGIALKARVLQESLAAEGSAQVRESEEIVSLVNESIRQTRTLARGLDPVDAGANGLPAALKNLAIQTEYLFRVECEFAASETRLNVTAPTGMALYRIAQEAIHNAVSHGQAQRIEIQLTEEGEDLNLRIRDDGKGFSPAAGPGAGMGLRIMQYRANSIGGRLIIHSSADRGSEVECVVAKRFCTAAGQNGNDARRLTHGGETD